MRHEARNLTDRFLRNVKPARKGERDAYPDEVVRGLHVRVTDTGTITFVLSARYPGAKKNYSTRRALDEYAPFTKAELEVAEKAYADLPAKEREGFSFEAHLLRTYGARTLAGAREKAKRWKALIKAGRDPARVEEQQRRAELRKQANTVAKVAEDFITEKLAGERKGKEAERAVRREFLPAWGPRPVTEITDLDIVAVIKAKKRTAPAEARNLLALAKRFFTWAVDQRVYGLKLSPADGLKPAKIIGKKRRGDRILSDDELFALWRAAKRIGYPFGSVYQILMLSALRLNEAADAAQPEFNYRNRQWIIPADRMKGENEEARPHLVPLTDGIMAILESLPSFKTGDHLFSTTFGASPVWMSDKVKKRVDKRMLRALRALARRRGEDPEKIKLRPWVNHDIRRTVRTNLSRLKVSEEAREAVMAHARPGIKGTYDLHDYADEKREALELWAARLRSIVEPPPDNVVQLDQARG